jgi:hypothetical protein
MAIKYETMWDNVRQDHEAGYCGPPEDLPEYYDETDAASIMSWNDEDAQRVIDKMKENFKNNIIHDVALCPFCQYQLIKCNLRSIDLYSMCIDCQYGQNHGRCPEDDSVYAQWCDYTPRTYKHIIKILED